jgi:hypothetical protein
MDRTRVAAALLLKRRRKLKFKRLWVHPINEKRNLFGEFSHLVRELRCHEDRFFSYFRMSPENFDHILLKIEPLISKRDTNYRKAISPHERLSLTLR